LACEAWFELGNSDEGLNELDSLEPRFQNHPRVLSWRCQFLEIKGRWEEILTISTKLCQIDPADIHGWLYHGMSLAALHKTREAVNPLSYAARKFGSDPFVVLQLARVHAANNDFNQAKRWLVELHRRGGGCFMEDAEKDPLLKSLLPQPWDPPRF
jgi:predicted Zn-dependent protease